MSRPLWPPRASSGRRRSRSSSHHSVVRCVRSVAAATLVAVAGIAALFGGLTGHGQTASAGKPVAMLQSVDSPNELRELRRSSLIDQGRIIPRNRQDPGESY